MKKIRQKKSRRATLKGFARNVSPAYPSKYSTDRESVYGNGKNYGVPQDYASHNDAASEAQAKGYDYIYINGNLYITGGGIARIATSVPASLDTLDLSIG